MTYNSLQSLLNKFLSKSETPTVLIGLDIAVADCGGAVWAIVYCCHWNGDNGVGWSVWLVGRRGNAQHHTHLGIARHGSVYGVEFKQWNASSNSFFFSSFVDIKDCQLLLKQKTNKNVIWTIYPNSTWLFCLSNTRQNFYLMLPIIPLDQIKIWEIHQ